MTGPEPTIVFLDAATYGDISLKSFTDRWNCTVYQVTSGAQTIERLAGHHIAVTNKVRFDDSVLSAVGSRELKLIVVAATGTDIIDRAQAAKFGIKVCNVPGYATDSVAQFTMALILELATGVGKYLDAVRRGEWEKSPIFSLLTYPTVELNKKKLGIVGYGRIGQAVARMARAFGLEILTAGSSSAQAEISRDRIPLDRLFQESDIVSLHCPLTAETRNLINARTISLMKPTSLLINTARGALIDEAALVDALRRRRIAGAALDVITEEPPAHDHAIVRAAKELDNLIVTPHTAWSARETRQRLLDEVMENILAFLRNQPRNLVV